MCVCLGSQGVGGRSAAAAAKRPDAAAAPTLPTMRQDNAPTCTRPCSCGGGLGALCRPLPFPPYLSFITPISEVPRKAIRNSSGRQDARGSDPTPAGNRGLALNGNTACPMNLGKYALLNTQRTRAQFPIAEVGKRSWPRAPPRSCVHRAGRRRRKCTSPPCKVLALRRAT